MPSDLTAAIIGGGFYGLRIALHLRESLGFANVIVFEREPEAMNRSSYINQARVHNGYHYPRSILTAYRSRVNFPDFVEEFGEAVVDTFEHYYAIASRLSKINARQFELFCSRIGAFYEPADDRMAASFSASHVEAAYRVREPAFDSRILRALLLDRIERVGGIDLRLSDEALSVASAGDGIEVTAASGTYRVDRAIGSVYSRLNELHRASGLPVVPLQHEVTEMALVEMPPAFSDIGLTVMDGPFFSAMPFPSRGLHTLSHVRYTPHHRWKDGGTDPRLDPHEVMTDLPEASRYASMRADVVRYVPGLSGMVHKDSIWEVKTVLAKSDNDDSRPILFRPDHGIPHYCCIMGGKLDNIYDVLQELTVLYA